MHGFYTLKIVENEKTVKRTESASDTKGLI